MKKNGIVLMMTLVMITVIMGIVALVLTQNKRVMNDAQKSYSQSSTVKIISDLEAVLPSLLTSLNSPEDLDFMMRIPMQLDSKNGEFHLKIRLSSPYSKLNINRLQNNDGSLNDLYVTAFGKIFTHYPIADQEKFLMIVQDTLDVDLAERSDGTEIKWMDGDFSNGSIESMEQFDRILEKYLALTKDTMILAVPWEKYIGFQGEKIDLNAVSPEILSLLLPEVLDEKIRQMTSYRTKAFSSKEEAVSVEPSLGAVFDNYFFIYQKALPYSLLCDLHLDINHQSEHVTFEYALLEKKIKHIEFL
jgi:hypothetical protein